MPNAQQLQSLAQLLLALAGAAWVLFSVVGAVARRVAPNSRVARVSLALAVDAERLLVAFGQPPSTVGAAVITVKQDLAGVDPDKVAETLAADMKRAAGAAGQSPPPS